MEDIKKEKPLTREEIIELVTILCRFRAMVENPDPMKLPEEIGPISVAIAKIDSYLQ